MKLNHKNVIFEYTEIEQEKFSDMLQARIIFRYLLKLEEKKCLRNIFLSLMSTASIFYASNLKIS